MLIVMSGLPGAGKTTLAAGLAAALHAGGHAAFLRVDEIEQALRGSGVLPGDVAGDVAGDVGPAGYMVAYALARSNLRLGIPVVADCVNPLRITRQAWRDVAAGAGAALVDVEVVCSDPHEHRRRLAERAIDVPGLRRVTWEDVAEREYEPWDAGPAIRIDTAGRTLADTLAELRRKLSAGTA